MLRGGITMINIEHSVLINRSIEEVWKFINNVENMRRWRQGVLEAQLTSEGPIGIGSTVHAVRQLLGRRRTGDFQVTEYEPNRKFTLKAALGPTIGQYRYSVEPVGNGTRLTGSAEVEIVGVYKLITLLFIRMVTREKEAELANVKRLLEA
jgi:carbon monoxide dehydrogenase subunit G